MRKRTTSQVVSVGGICCAIAGIFQLAPVFIPGFGLLLSPLSSLPVILAALYSVKCGSFTYVCTGLLVSIFSPQESVIFLLTTGVFGLIIGLTFHKKWIMTVFFSGITLFSGINILTYFVGIAALGDALNGVATYLTVIITFVFSVVYSFLWLVFLKLIFRKLKIPDK